MAAGDQDQGYVPQHQPGGQKQGQTQTTPVQQTTPAHAHRVFATPMTKGYVPRRWGARKRRLQSSRRRPAVPAHPSSQHDWSNRIGARAAR